MRTRTCAIHSGNGCDSSCPGFIYPGPSDEEAAADDVARSLDGLDGKTELGTAEATTIEQLIAAGLTAEEAEFILAARPK